MNIAIIGCGAMGAIYAGLFAAAGHAVRVVDSWAAHVHAINDHGLTIDGASGHRCVRVQAHTTVPPEAKADLVILAVKSAAAGAAAESALSLATPDTVFITIQNGLGAADEVARKVAPDRLIVGIAGGFGASLRGPGHAHHNGMNIIRLGAHAGIASATVAQIVALWCDAGFHTEAAADILSMQWDKLICNVAYSAPCALANMTVGEAMDDEELGPVSRAAASEAWAVARAKGISLAFDDPVAHVRAFAARMPDARPSLLLDHLAGRPSEIDYINGAIGREARALGLDAPVNDTLTRLVRIKERHLGTTTA